MNVLILEDELPAFNKLVKLLNATLQNCNIVAHLDSITSAKEWFSKNNEPDLIFMDIHLADGSAFTLLEDIEIKTPIIFTTAYDQYAIKAFNTAGIAYLLKPVKQEELSNAIDKLSHIKNSNIVSTLQSTLTNIMSESSYKTRFLVRFGDNILSVQTEDIAYFYSENKATFAKTFEGRTLPIDSNLDALDQILNPNSFFRINRQYIISLESINEMKAYSKARVLVKLKPEVQDAPLVSSERSANFKQWLAGEAPKAR